MTNVEYTVYETAYKTYDPIKGLKLLTHPVATYNSYNDMIKDWLDEFFAGTHNFFVTMDE